MGRTATERCLRRVLSVGLLMVPALLASCGGTPESAEEAAARYPNRPITWIVSFEPGGGSDIEVRRIQPALERLLGTSIQIQYRSGGGGAVGWAELVGQPPDGYTAGGLVLPHMIVQPLALTETGYTTEQIRPVAWNVSAASALMVSSDSRFKTMSQFMDYARAHPGELTVGGVETFSASDMALAQLVKSSGIDVNYVPVTGGAGPLLNSLRGGHVDAAMLSTAHVVRTDGVAALAVGGAERFARLPDVPTFAELGYEVTIAYVWGVGVPQHTPDAIAARLGNAVIEVMKETRAGDALLKEGLLPVLIGPDRAVQYVADQKTTIEALIPLLRNMSR